MLRRRFSGPDDLNGVGLGGLRSRPAPPHSGSAAVAMAAAPPVRSPEASELLLGRVNMSPRSFGFVTTAEGQAYYIRPDKARRLLGGDIVQFRAMQDGKGDLEVRDIRRVTRRSQVLLCGVAQMAGLTYLVPDEPCFTPVQLAPAPPDGSFATGDVIAVRLPAFEGNVQGITDLGGVLLGVFVANLGVRTRDGFDLDYARMKHGFEADLPTDLHTLAAGFEDPADMEPTEAATFVTIDGESTRDFDDEVYAEPRAGGGWLVKVGVADVSRYVTPGTPLDSWAAGRGTSVYLPRLTLPMLPEVLSTDRCSLLPGVPRYAVVMHLELDATGTVLSRRLDRAITVSAARLTYREVADFLAATPVEPRYSVAVEANLRALHEVYQVLAARRASQGRLDFEDPEPTAKMRDGRVVVEWEVRTDAHKLVEELMLLANTQAAGLLVERFGLGLFRHQPPPTNAAWEQLSQWAQGRGHALPAGQSLRGMADLVQAMPEGDSRAEAVLKVRMTMQPARYVAHTRAQLEEQGGHFSLCAPWYTHFTSPIRRYADLLVHRLLLAPADHKLSEAEVGALYGAVERCSERSQASRLAERLVWDRLKLAGFLAEHDRTSVIAARVVRVNARGFRVVLSGWQVSAWLPGAELRRAGITLGCADVWFRGEGAEAQPVREGSTLQVSWTCLNVERPAYPELQVTMAE